MKAADVAKAIQKPEQERIFRTRGENEYSLEILPAGLEFYVSRLRRTSEGLHGELTASVMNGHFPKAHTIDGRVLSSADMNFGSAQTRVQRAKLCKDRCGPEGEELDWVGFVEELSVRMILADRQGEPSVILADVPKLTDDTDSWVFDGFPILRRHPTVLFGRGASGKSYFAMWIAGQLANQGVPVAYLDWELAGDDHRYRLERLFQPSPRAIHYIRCNHPLRDRMDHIQRIIKEQGCQYVVFDSVGPASRAQGGRFQDGDLGQEYFGLVRRFGVGSLHVAHPPKNTEEGKDATVFGSAFFEYLARSVWFVEAAENAPPGQLLMGLYHHKLTTGSKLAPRAYRLTFEGNRTRVESTDLKQSDDLIAKLPLLDQIKHALASGAMTTTALAEDLGVTKNIVRAVVSKHKSMFIRIGPKIGLIDHGETQF